MQSLSLPRGALPLLLALGLALVTMGVAGSWVGADPDAGNAIVPALVTWGSSGAVAALWLAMAFGFGGRIVDRLGLAGRRPVQRVALEGALGIAAALALDSFLGTIGALVAFRGIATWVITLAGIVLLVGRWRSPRHPPVRLRLSIVAIAAGPALGILFLAAASEPGWLWGSEFGGYDALSYHLPLPAEWLRLGAIRTLPHNVYSAFPSFVEAAFLHCFALAGGPANGALTAQCLAALTTLVAALNVACLARRFAGPIAACAAFVLYLATPWIVVVGSLAYNDGFVGLFLAAALLVVLKPPRASFAFGAALGLLLGAAIGAKLTAVGFVAVPVALAALATRRARALAPLAIAGVVALFLVAPWLVRNAIATRNPTFPFLATAFGTGHWTAEQVAIFAKAHASDLPIADRFARLWSMWLAFGFGANPSPRDPWAMQWSILPWLGLAGCAILATRPRLRGVAATLLVVLVAQCAFWIVATHLQSRFLAPTAVVLAAAAASSLTARRWRGAEKPATLALLGLALLPAWIYRFEPATDHSASTQTGAPAALVGNRGIVTGEAHRAALEGTKDANARNELLKLAPPAFWVNFALPAPTPEDPRAILLIGDATPFRYQRPLAYTTVWDRGAFDAVVAQAPDHPEQWAAALRALGFRYALIDTTMLSRWLDSGWLNPAITPDRLREFTRGTKPLARMQNGTLIVDLGAQPPPASAPAPTATPNAANP
ncbi:MAG: hypothetical protein U0572_17385 [Phycisphaerales bacterium]